MPAVVNARITTQFGVRGSHWAVGFHTGVDYPVWTGTKIHVQKACRVVFRGWGGWGQAYGLHVIVQYPDGRRGLFAHLSSASVRAGSRLAQGALIGRSGASGNVTGPHLHYEERVAPYRYGSDARRPIHNVGGAVAVVKKAIPPAWRSSKSVVSLANLKPGKTNIDVRDVQNALIKKGFWKKGQKVTGYFGPLTKFYIRKFQQSKHYKNTTGIPGKGTCKDLGLKAVK